MVKHPRLHRRQRSSERLTISNAANETTLRKVISPNTYGK